MRTLEEIEADRVTLAHEWREACIEKYRRVSIAERELRDAHLYLVNSDTARKISERRNKLLLEEIEVRKAMCEEAGS